MPLVCRRRSSEAGRRESVRKFTFAGGTSCDPNGSYREFHELAKRLKPEDLNGTPWLRPDRAESGQLVQVGREGNGPGIEVCRLLP